MGTGWSKLPGGREVEVLREGVSEVKLAMLSFSPESSTPHS
jgi:hypothetical protein